jgi:hypothetical protein
MENSGCILVKKAKKIERKWVGIGRDMRFFEKIKS